MLKHICLTIVATLVAGALSLVAVPPANAVTYVDVDATGVTIRGSGCEDALIDVYGDWVDADITVSLVDPDGYNIAEETFSNESTGVLNLYVTMCGYDPAGTYHVYVDAYDHNDDTEVTGADTFTVTKVAAPSKTKSKIAMKRKYQPRGAFKWQVSGKLTRAGKAYKRQRVELQARIGGAWLEIEAARSNRKGLVGWQFKPNRFRWRFHFDGNGSTKASNSKAFRTPGNGRTVGGGSPESLVANTTGAPDTAVQHQLTRR